MSTLRLGMDRWSKVRRKTLLLLVALFLHGLPASARHQGKLQGSRHEGLLPVKLAVGSGVGNIVYLQIDLAQALHYFEAEGLKVKLIPYARGAEAASALYRKQVDFSANSLDHAITAPVQSPVKMVASFTDLPTVTVVVRRDLRSQIRSLKDLKGKRVGVTSFGAGTHVLTASILASVGYTVHDVTMVPVGAGDSLIAAIRQKKVDAAITTDPTTIRLLMNGEGSLLLDMVTEAETQRVLRGHYQFTGLLTRVSTINERPELVQRMVNAMVNANHFIATHSAAEVASLLSPEIVGDRYVYVKSLEHSRGSISQTSMVDSKAVENVIQSLQLFGAVTPSVRINPQDFYDMQFVTRAQGH